MGITSWGRVAGFMYKDLPDQTVERKLSLCREYLAVLDTVDGGISHNIGITAWELQSAHIYLLNKRFKEEKLSLVKFVEGLKEGRAMCHTAQKGLTYCTEDSDEGRM